MSAESNLRRPTLKVPAEKIDILIDERFRNDPIKQAELRTRAGILSPMLRDPNRLGLSSEVQASVRDYANRAGKQARKKETEAKLNEGPLQQIDSIMAVLENEQRKRNDLARADRLNRARERLREQESWWRPKFYTRVKECSFSNNSDYRKDPIGTVAKDLFDHPIFSILDGESPKYVEYVLKMFGVDLPFNLEEFKVDKDKIFQSVVGYDTNGKIKGLETKIKGVEVTVYHLRSHPNVISSITGRVLKEGLVLNLKFTNSEAAVQAYNSPLLPPLDH